MRQTPSGCRPKMDHEILLATERIYLRRFGPEDASLLFALDNDPEVMRFISKGPPTSLKRIQEEIMPRLLGYYRPGPQQGFWVAHLRANDEFIGWFHLRPDKLVPKEMELGYRLMRRVWGRGLATEGSRALIGRAFGEWNYGRVCARTLAANLASRRVMEKSGLLFEEEFVWAAEVMPEWNEEERRGVKYGLANVK